MYCTPGSMEPPVVSSLIQYLISILHLIAEAHVQMGYHEGSELVAQWDAQKV